MLLSHHYFLSLHKEKEKEMSHTVYLALGSNLGDRGANLVAAIAEIEKKIGNVCSQSDVIATEPEGFESCNKFLNMAVCVETELDAPALLDATQHIERQLGRLQKSVDGIYHDRTIDIDILLYDAETMHTRRLTIPHPRMTSRRFVLQPLAQIAPALVIPGEKLTIAELLARIS